MQRTGEPLITLGTEDVITGKEFTSTSMEDSLFGNNARNALPSSLDAGALSNI
jgi:hypothetical protein